MAYWNPKTWSLSHTPTSPHDWKMPLPVALFAMAAMGGLFVVFLPAIGFWVTGKALLGLAARGCRALVRLVAHA